MEVRSSEPAADLPRTPSGSEAPNRKLFQTTLTNFFTEKRISRGNPKVKEEKEGEASDTTQPAKTPSQKKKKKGESKTGKRDKNDGERKGRTRKTNKNDGEREANASKGNRNEGERRRKRKQNSKGDGGQDLSLSQSTVEQKNVLREGERGNGNADDPAGNGGRGDQQPEEGDEGAAQPDEEPAPVGVQEEYIAVVLELETTDFAHRTADILQIAATPWLENGGQGEAFTVHALPSQPIKRYAAKVNGYFFDGASLWRFGEAVPAVSLLEGLRRFLDWLRSLGPTKKLLVCHSAQRFHSPILERHVDAQGLREEFEDAVVGFSDTLGVFRELDPERRASKSSFRRDDLVQDYLGEKIERHDCVDSVRHLASLLSYFKAQEVIRRHSFYTGYSPHLRPQ